MKITHCIMDNVAVYTLHIVYHHRSMARRVVQQGDEPLHGCGGPENDRAAEYGDKPHKFDNSS